MQPKPTKGKRPVTEQVIRDLRKRRVLGKKKYGRVLETHNGRDFLADAYEELLDQVQYFKGFMEEQKWVNRQLQKLHARVVAVKHLDEETTASIAALILRILKRRPA